MKLQLIQDCRKSLYSGREINTSYFLTTDLKAYCGEEYSSSRKLAYCVCILINKVCRDNESILRHLWFRTLNIECYYC